MTVITACHILMSYHLDCVLYIDFIILSWFFVSVSYSFSLYLTLVVMLKLTVLLL